MKQKERIRTMKTHIRRIVCWFLALALTLGLHPALRLPAAAANVTVNTTNFPDDKFRAYVTAYLDTDKNGVLSDAERQNDRLQRPEHRLPQGRRVFHSPDQSGLQPEPDLRPRPQQEYRPDGAELL